ncbi:MAG: hypothetical protein CR967_05350 [Proteobacteria bacterium]|nr:MAG: hypothetical protein CR967_05350 [Pseudomonadota bacterium]
MLAVAIKMILCLIIALLIGIVIGYLLCRMCRKCDDKKECHDKKDSDCCDGNAHGVLSESIKEEKPVAVDRSEVVPDDLKNIKGVGPKIEEALNDLGVYTFEQIASWNRENVAWVDEHLVFKGRIDREEWIEQAKILAQGKETEFSKRFKS